MGIFPLAFPVLEGAGRHIGFHAQNGFDPLLLAFLVKIDHPVHGPMVRDGQSVHAQGFGFFHQLRNSGGAV